MSLSERKKNIINIILLIAYAGLHIFLVLHHEPWRDESQAWILARNASFLELPGLCASEGHPVLWFFFLRVCFLIGIPFRHISYISVFIMTAAAALLLYRSPFNLPVNVSILVSPIFFYYNPVVCRIYCIVVLLFILQYIFWKDRSRHPVIYGITVALLCQTHVLAAGFVIGCLFEMVIRLKKEHGRKNIAGALIPAASLFLMYLELRQTDSTDTYIHVNADHFRRRIENHPLSEPISSLYKHFDYDPVPAGRIFLGATILIMILLIVLWAVKKKQRKELFSISLVTFSGIIYFWAVVIFVRNAAHQQMAILYWLLIMFCVWAFADAFKEGRLKLIFILLFAASCVLSVPGTYINARNDIEGPYAGTTEIRDIIENTVPADSVIVIHNDMFSTSLAAYLYESDKNYTLWDIDNGCEFDLHIWGRDNARDLDDEDIYEAICRDIPADRICYYVYGTETLGEAPEFTEGMILISGNHEENYREEYHLLYQVER